VLKLPPEWKATKRYFKYKKPLPLTYKKYFFARHTILNLETKLTLRLNEKVIERAKVYARIHNISLSKLIESYLDSISNQKEMTKKLKLPRLLKV
jgi:hypothetical protein